MPPRPEEGRGQACPAADATKGFVRIAVTALHVVARAEQRSDDGTIYLRVNAPDGFKLVRIKPEHWRKPDQSATDEVVDVAVAYSNVELYTRYVSGSEISGRFLRHGGVPGTNLTSPGR